MRFNEFKKPLVEFAQDDFAIPEIDIIGPTDPNTASINKQNALLLLQLDPDPSAMKEVQKLIAQFTANNELQPADATSQVPDPAAANTDTSTANVDNDQAEQPASADQMVAPETEENPDEIEEDLTEGKKAQDIGSRVALLNENDPEQAELLARIEAILESKKIEPVITKIVESKFTFHLSDIIETFKNAIVSVKVSISEKVKFLSSCKQGFFDMSSVKTTPYGNLYSGIPGEIFDAIKEPLFRMEFGTGGNKLGKGEALLAIIGKGAFKGEKGDIQLQTGEEIEIKASSGDKGPSGAVLVALGKGEAEDGKKGKESAYGANTEAGKTFKNLIAKSYSTRTNVVKLDQIPNSITGTSIAKFFNPFILKNPARGPATINAIKEAYRIIFKKEKNPAFFDRIDAALTEDGIDINVLTRTIRGMEFDYYKKVIKHDAVLFMNGTTGTYRYFETGGMLSSQLATSSTGANLYSTGVIDFSGSYGNGFGKIFTK
jgi:hypothetical protein